MDKRIELEYSVSGGQKQCISTSASAFMGSGGTFKSLPGFPESAFFVAATPGGMVLLSARLMDASSAVGFGNRCCGKKSPSGLFFITRIYRVTILLPDFSPIDTPTHLCYARAQVPSIPPPPYTHSTYVL